MGSRTPRRQRRQTLKPGVKPFRRNPRTDGRGVRSLKGSNNGLFVSRRQRQESFCGFPGVPLATLIAPQALMSVAVGDKNRGVSTQTLSAVAAQNMSPVVSQTAKSILFALVAVWIFNDSQGHEETQPNSRPRRSLPTLRRRSSALIHELQSAAFRLRQNVP